MRNRKPSMTALIGGACSLIILAAPASGQQAATKQRSPRPAAAEARAAASQTLQLPPGQPVVELTVQAPGEARVGQSFDYQIRVHNKSKNIAVHDLVISQLAGEGFEIESAEIQGEPSKQHAKQAGQQQSADEQRQSKQKARGEAEDNQQRDGDNEEAEQDESSDRQPKSEDDRSQSDQSKGDESQSKPQEESNAESKSADSDNAAEEQPQDEEAAEARDAEESSQPADASQSDAAAGKDSERSQSARSRGVSSKADRSASKSKTGTADGSRWKIDRLMPGESRTIVVTASSDAEGAGNVCVAVESYMPALCLTTRFTKPELEIVKQAPEVANICDEIKFDYLVRNTGTGDLQRFTVRDELPEGLQTVKGARSLEFTLNDGLKAGETRKFEARLRATRTGDFTSRASVEGSEGLEARSNRAGTKVQKADLALAIVGPRAQEVGGLANYTVRITNRGDAPAPGAQLRVYFPRSADLVRAGQPQPSSQAVESSAAPAAGSGSDAEHATHQHRSQSDEQAKPQEQQQDDQQEDQQADEDDQQAPAESQQQAGGDARDQARREQNRENQQRQQMAQHLWQLGTLAPGQTVEVTYVLRPYEGGDLEQAAVAEYVCATAQDREMLQAETQTTTEILMLAGLRLTVVDDRDPVPAGQNVTYTVAVLNQGNAAAHNVEISAQLPKELKFVEAKGATAGENSENEVTFAPVETLEPGKQVVWQLVASVNEGVGEKTQESIEVTLDCDDLEETITSQEPTTFFEAEKRTARSSDSESEEADKK